MGGGPPDAGCMRASRQTAESGGLAAITNGQRASIQCAIPNTTAIQATVTRNKAATSPTHRNTEEQSYENGEQSAALHAAKLSVFRRAVNVRHWAITVIRLNE